MDESPAVTYDFINESNSKDYREAKERDLLVRCFKSFKDILNVD